MTSPHLDALEFVVRTRHYDSLSQLNEAFADLISKFGFRSFIFTGLPKPGEDVEPLVIANEWPSGWTERYRSQNYFPADPVSRWSLTKKRPFLWREAQRQDSSRRAVQIAGEAWEHDLADGIAYPLREYGGGAVVSVASDYSFRDDERAQASLFLASSYYKMAAEALCGRDKAAPALTGREIEVAHWAAAGKTVWETSEILSIAEATVKAHLTSIRDKLSVATTTQAVAKLVMWGFIQP
jgi:LuxR family quorum sensing-dependent transcriptional regulator